MNLYVVRHASTYNNKKNLVNGRNNIDINEQGIREAQKVGEILKEVVFDKVFCSPLLRAKSTMKLINVNNYPVIYDERITERDAGIMTNKSEQELDFSKWHKINIKPFYGGSESFDDVIKRVKNFLEEIVDKYKEDTLLLVTHAGVMKAIDVCIYGYPGIDKIEGWRYPNCVVLKYKL